MFAKGPIPGWSPKGDCLKVHPKALCTRMVTGHESMYKITLEDKILHCDFSARGTWESFWCKLVDEGKLDRKGNIIL